MLLLPVAFVFRGVVAARKQLYSKGLLKSWRAPVPLLVVGNISVGGTGKTPLVLALIELFSAQGIRAGVVSRGYKSKNLTRPTMVEHDSSTQLVGDEPLMIARASGAPVCVFPDRKQAVETLLSSHPVDIVIADDGLQHYALQRDIEIAVVDGQRLQGNGYLLPAGPLREPVSRLESVDFVLYNSSPDESQVDLDTTRLSGTEYSFDLCIEEFESLDGSQQRSVDSFRQITCHAMAGIGNPRRFFSALSELEVIVVPHAFPDHYRPAASELQALNDKPLLMTEKDAIKCRELLKSPEENPGEFDHCWFAKTAIMLPAEFESAIVAKIRSLLNHRESNQS